MLLTITTTHADATDLGYLLHKHPAKLQSIPLTVGKAHVFYPEATPERTTAALLLDVDPIDMVRGNKSFAGRGFSLGQYVNDRPYVASSFLSVAIAKTFSTALNGTCKQRPELVRQPLPLEAKIAVLPAPKGGEILIRKLFEPLGYTMEVERHALDPQFPEWGDSKYFTVRLSNHLRLSELLAHLYVLIPVLDNDKHYYISRAEIDKLLAKGAGWLDAHPEREQIVRRYLGNFGSLVRPALERLREGDSETDTDEATETPATNERRETLHQHRLRRVVETLKVTGAKTVLDLGCGEGKLMRLLLREKQFQRIVGTDVSYRELARAKERLHWDDLPPRQRERLDLFQSALTYRDARLTGFDAAALVEVIEHLDEDRLDAFERVVFEFAKPRHIVLTTPNAEYNARYEFLESGAMRHDDHRFEWTRAQFQNWANRTAAAHGYSVRFEPLGEVDPEVGAPSQMAVFELRP